MCPSLSLQRLSVLPGSGAQALGDESGSCPLVEGAAGAAVIQVGPITVGRGVLLCSEASGLLSWRLPCVRQHGQAALLVPGRPLLCATLLGDSLRACPWWDSDALSGNAAANGDKNNLEGWQMLPKRGGGRGCIVLKCIVPERRPSLPLPYPFPILASPRRVSAGKALLILQNQPFTLQEVEAQLEIFTSPKIMDCEEFGGLPRAGVCSSVTWCWLRKAACCWVKDHWCSWVGFLNSSLPLLQLGSCR